MQTRRQFLRRAGTMVASGATSAATSGAVAGLGLGAAVRRAAAKGPTLRIAQWTHFVPAFDEWFDRTFTREWGEKNGVTVEVDHVSVSELRQRATSEVAARQGHDLFGFLDSPVSYADHAVPLDDVVGECERRFGRLAGLAHRSTFSPKSKRYYALSDFWAPTPLHYRVDWWGEAGVKPETWDRVREGTRRIREKNGATAGFGLAPEPDSNTMLRGLLWSFGSSEQDEAGGVTINSRATIEAIKLMTAIYRESMTPDVFMWDPSSNNRMFVWGRASIIQNPISAMRTAEKQNPELAKKAALAPPAAGPKERITAANPVHCYVIWKFSPAADLAKRFLVDLVATADEAFRASEFYNFPSFPKSVPDIEKKLAADKLARGRYTLLAGAEKWSACAGYPWYVTPATDEVVTRGVIPNMFARVARGDQSAEDSARQAEAEMKRVFARWAR